MRIKLTYYTRESIEVPIIIDQKLRLGKTGVRGRKELQFSPEAEKIIARALEDHKEWTIEDYQDYAILHVPKEIKVHVLNYDFETMQDLVDYLKTHDEDFAVRYNDRFGMLELFDTTQEE